MPVLLAFLLNRHLPVNGSMLPEVRYDRSNCSFWNSSTHSNLVIFEELGQSQDDPLHLGWDFLATRHDYKAGISHHSKKTTDSVPCTRCGNHKAFQYHYGLLGCCGWQSVGFSASFGVISEGMRWLVVEIWAVHCCRWFLFGKMSRGNVVWKRQ